MSDPDTNQTTGFEIFGPVTILPPLEVPCGMCSGTGDCPECGGDAPDDGLGGCTFCHSEGACPECCGIGLEEQV